MSTPARVVIAGASAAGLATLESLRRGGFEGEVTLVGDERHAPYDRPPLSKRVLDGSWEPDRATLRPQAHLDGLGAQWRLGVRATGADLAAGRVSLSDGDTIPFDRLVVATGVTPRRLPLGEGLDGIHVLRRLEDALALRQDLLAGGPLVVVGAGPLGCEVAATAQGLGIDVALVDVLSVPMERHVGPEIGGLLRELHLARGVALHLGAGVAALHGEAGRVTVVELADGTRLPAATVLVAIGSVPATAWLEGSGVPLGNGIVCDERCRATETVYAAGDVAEWLNPRFGVRMRVEHRMNANDHGATVAAGILGNDVACDAIPHFWSDQYDVKLQAHGLVSHDAEVAFENHDEAGMRFAAVYRRAGVMQGVLGWNIPRELRAYRGALAEAPTVMA